MSPCLLRKKAGKGKKGGREGKRRGKERVLEKEKKNYRKKKRKTKSKKSWQKKARFLVFPSFLEIEASLLNRRTLYLEPDT